MKLKILVGTTTGTAENLALAIQLACADLADPIEVIRMDGLDGSVFDDPQALYLLCTATYGAGDVPDNAWALYESLESQPRYLGHVRYGVMALGDSAYPSTFCNGGQRFDARLQDLGARRLGEVWCHDASAGTVPEEEGSSWARTWLTREWAPS